MRMRVMIWTALGVGGLCLAGCGDSAPAKGSAAAGGSAAGNLAGGSTAGSSALGGTGAGGAAVAGGGAVIGLEDPAPAEPDLAGLITTSAKWLLVTEEHPVVVSSSLDFIDLESGMHYPVNPGDLPVAYAYWSPDQKAFVFSGANGDSDKNLSIVRLTKTGFLPAQLVQGFEGTRGSFAVLDWDETARFFTVARAGSMSSGVEVIDSVLGKRLGHLDFPPSFSHRFAPQGLYFSYAHGDDLATLEVGLSRVVKDGIAPPTILPRGSYMPLFSRDGRHAYYGATQNDVVSQHYLDLPDTTPKELVIAGPGELLTSSAAPGPTSASMLAYVQRSETDRSFVQVFFDGRPRVELSRPGAKVRFQFGNADNSVLAIDYETSLDIVNVEPFFRHPLPGTTTMDAAQLWTTGVVGKHVYHQVNGQLFIATIDAGGALSDVAVSEPGEDVSVCDVYTSHPPTTKLSYRTSSGNQLVIVDLALSPPAAVARLTASMAESKFYCPEWLVDETALLANETGDAGGKLYVVKWDGAAPAAPVKVLESTSKLQGHAFSY